MRFRKSLFLLSFLLFCSWNTKNVFLFPYNPKCGDTLKITITKTSPSKKFIAEFNQKKYFFYPIRQKNQCCLIPLSCKFRPGKYKINLFRLHKKKKKLLWSKKIEIRPGIFRRIDLKLRRKKSRLLSPPKKKPQGKKFQYYLKSKIPFPLWQGKFIRPVKGRITDWYGTYRTINKTIPWNQHKGVDFGAPKGTPVYASNKGIVVLAKPFSLQGKLVLLDHGEGIQTVYMHLSSTLVQPGEMVKKGKLIGRVGSTGLSTGAHLHWGLYINGITVNPLTWLKYEY
jgi:murein DD-endopeptidase MepM/ murein hydrolase activator NlpD